MYRIVRRINDPEATERTEHATNIEFKRGARDRRLRSRVRIDAQTFQLAKREFQDRVVKCAYPQASISLERKTGRVGKRLRRLFDIHLCGCAARRQPEGPYLDESANGARRPRLLLRTCEP